ncbi:MAG: Minf_1886 family protein [Phycisphaerales bacterium]
MAQSPQITIDWDELLKAAGPYPIEAFHFVREGLNHTVIRAHEDAMSVSEIERHVNGRELCLGLAEFAIDQYGMMAPAVLHHWQIHRTDDFGRIVFAMIDFGVMSKTPEDSLEDFRAVYDFREVFSRDELVGRIGRGG